MSRKELPCSENKIRSLIATYGTPFHLYDEAGIRRNARALQEAFSWNNGFKEYFAVKANPNPHLLQIFKEEGCGADCSSLAELVLASAVGWENEEIMFSSNNTPYEEYERAKKDEVIINVDDISHLEPLRKKGLLPEHICFRYNPGEMGYGNDIIGLPQESKYGMTKEQVFESIRFAMRNGIKKIGLHTMVVSNELNENALVETARMMFLLAIEVKKKYDIKVDLINLGGGIGLPYRPEERKVDYTTYGTKVKALFDELLRPAGLNETKLALECGRIMTGPYGWLVTTAIHHKNIYKDYIGLDTCMADLMRPALYGAYHHITVLGKEDEKKTRVYDVVGSLCENNDKFAIDRMLPEIVDGDNLIIHDTGAHGYAMGFNYNGKLKSKELLLRENGEVELIRRAETLNDYFATLDYPGLTDHI